MVLSVFPCGFNRRLCSSMTNSCKTRTSTVVSVRASSVVRGALLMVVYRGPLYASQSEYPKDQNNLVLCLG